MTKISTRVKILGLISIGLWLIGSYVLFDEKNGKAICLVTVVIIIAGLYSQYLKDQKENSEF